MIVFDHVSKGFRDNRNNVNWVIKNACFTVADKSNFGVLAPRGQGKTVLVDLICGSHIISRGRILRNKLVSPPFTSRTHLHGKFSLSRNLRFMCDVYGRHFDEAIDFVEEFGNLGRAMNKSFGAVSNDIKGRFIASALFAMKFDHIVIDDSVSLGDAEFRRKCIDYLLEKKDEVSCVVASGNPKLISELCSDVAVLHEGKLTVYDNASSAIERFEEIDKVLV